MTVALASSSAALMQPLQAGCAALGLALTETQLVQLLDFLALLQKWNKVYNLTAVRDPQEMLTHHLLDSLAAVGPLQHHLRSLPEGSSTPPCLLDVGSGGGLPGVVFAICCPELQVSCVDTVAKKAAFIQQVAASLGLRNLRGIHARVESLQQAYDVVSCRAFASLLDFTTWSRAALASQGIWLAMKGQNPQAEIAALPRAVQVVDVQELTVPGLAAQRCIVWLRSAQSDV